PDDQPVTEPLRADPMVLDVAINRDAHVSDTVRAAPKLAEIGDAQQFVALGWTFAVAGGASLRVSVVVLGVRQHRGGSFETTANRICAGVLFQIIKVCRAVRSVSAEIRNGDFSSYCSSSLARFCQTWITWS